MHISFERLCIPNNFFLVFHIVMVCTKDIQGNPRKKDNSNRTKDEVNISLVIFRVLISVGRVNHYF